MVRLLVLTPWIFSTADSIGLDVSITLSSRVSPLGIAQHVLYAMNDFDGTSINSHTPVKIIIILSLFLHGVSAGQYALHNKCGNRKLPGDLSGVAFRYVHFTRGIEKFGFIARRMYRSVTRKWSLLQYLQHHISRTSWIREVAAQAQRYFKGVCCSKFHGYTVLETILIPRMETGRCTREEHEIHCSPSSSKLQVHLSMFVSLFFRRIMR